ncbi:MULTISPECIES: ClpXP protease specificity-enhancing factor [Acinetobacter]|uniref:ClpXP protease specificity-enhancing factor n=1 Tax=Acinetobacter TaxID=469 RepID=UPI0009937E0D|nr:MULTISPECIES: ClpXP protease specificity-enhancing factor [Acinetobacter]MCL6237194.1 ClpXP protease specificity-enhancing factor [Acinetobacter amyesii]MCL6243833.1 ClpXP protease specificity-enhancing factor [Acinetobacter amyesii]OOV79953.1 ClpXP protease specificity-enhancing factor [Acinetobacter sp. ANC 5600]QOW50558.1 ClpXP protease specificity-enhancing factor [Acinetobacter sp. YH12138]UIJ75176.1 ClpXP protease specificity-enhancing factor [Acinetobacter sp. SH20PTE14]
MSEQELQLTPTRPYLTRALYEWICDNQLTPYLLVDATQNGTMVPVQYIQDGQIVLNIAPHATHALHMSNETITFSARFGGVSQNLYIPFSAVLGIYARENGQGMFFDPQEYEGIQNDQNALKSNDQEQQEQPKKKPGLRLLD